MYTLEQLRADIAEVVNYNWQDEERDHQEQLDTGNEEGATHHIFHVLKRLDEFVTSKEATQ